MVFRLAHISDIHLGPLPPVKRRELLNKRITGYANWKRNRGRSMATDTLAQLMSHVERANHDHLAVTGDLVNIALAKEFELTARWLETVGKPEDVSVVPGNHDAYVPGALETALASWGPFLRSDDGRIPSMRLGFPFLRQRGPIAIIGVNSAVTTLPLLASGRFGGTQARALASILDETAQKGLFRVILIHHPPVHGAAARSKRLHGIRLFQSVIGRHGAELVLHGHTHIPQHNLIAGPNGAQVPVIGVPSASQAVHSHRPAAGFNLFEIDGSAQSGWHCTLTRHSLTTAGGDLEAAAPVHLLEATPPST